MSPFKKSKDVLLQKKEKLGTLTTRSNNAINLVTSTIDDLTNINAEIHNTLDEIDVIRSEYARVEGDLQLKSSQNAKIISRFKSLIED